MQARDLLITAITIAVCLITPVTHAATVNASAAIAFGNSSPYPPNPPADVQDIDPGPTSASAQVSGPRGESDAHAAADDGGHLAAQATFNGAQGQYTNVIANAAWTENFTANAGSSATFDFFIPQALLGFGANNVSNLNGGFAVDISLNGVSQFSATAEILTTGSFPSTPADMPLEQTGTILTSSFISGSVAPGFGAGYVFNSYGDSLDLAPVAGDNTLVYTMSTFVRGLIGETSAIAYIGDPLSLSQSGGNPGIPGSTLTVDGGVPPVPVPAAIWLFGTALVGFIGISRRRN